MSKNNHSALINFLNVRQSGLRSINVESDLHNDSLVDEYILTAQARSSLERMLFRFEENAPARSWTLTGPYGSGKSYYGLFLMNLMGTAQQSHKKVLKQLKNVDSPLAGQVTHVLNHGSTLGMLPIPITGFRATLQECLKHGLSQSLANLKDSSNIKFLAQELEHWNAQMESHAITQWFRQFTGALQQLGYLGALLVFDEMGKPLEYAASHPDITDIYLLQELAEFANRSGDVPFVFMGILHQAFERYAALLDGKTQLEWSKVQGRFEDIAFQEPPNQQLRLLANTIEYFDERQVKDLLISVKRVARKIAGDGWCPPMLKSEELVDLSLRSYPFHPSTLVALPYLFRRLAQNERSIFAYLASHEPAGFQEFISKNEINSFIRLPDLFDYLSVNFQGRLYATGRARAITETIDRLSNVSNLSQTDIDTLKTIGLLNWLSEVSHLQASEANIFDALVSSHNTNSDIRNALKNLQTRSLIVYRRFNKTYSIWQGSDVDIEERRQQAQQHLGGSFSIADAVQKYLPPHPIVARRHTYMVGTIRYFEVRYIDSFIRTQINLSPSVGASGIVLICLPTNFADVDEFTKWANSPEVSGRADLVVGILEKTGRLTELLSELRALHWVQDNTGELQEDSVARRELRTRLNAIETLIQNEMERTLSLHRLTDVTTCKWFYQGKSLTAKSNEGLSHLLSKICDDLYSESPVIWNEIINRRVLSSQGAAARRNLIEGMLSHASKPQLGIEGFPPERSLYDSLLKASGLHHKNKEGEWEFVSPKRNDDLNLRSVWKMLYDSIFNHQLEPIAVDSLFRKLSSPPYGVTDGVLPILLCAFLIIYRSETTLYLDGSLLPEPSIADWEMLLRRPDLFSVAGSRITGTRQDIVERFARGFRTEPEVMPVVRAIVKGVKSLPEHTLRTQKLSPHAIGVRTAVEQARSPEQLLFNDLSVALEMDPFEGERLVKDRVNVFFSRLNKAFDELVNEMARLLSRSRDELLNAFGLETGQTGWDAFRLLAQEMSVQVTNPNLSIVLKLASETSDSLAALESVLAQIAERAPRTWTDADSDRFSKKVTTLGNAFLKEYKVFVPEASLSAEQRKRSQKLIKELRVNLQKAYKDDPQVLKAVLQTLIREYSNEFDIDN